MKIQLKINGEWAVLPPDFSLKMMKTSPLFSDQGDFSYPFELPVEPNRHIFGPIADPMGFVRLREFHALPAEIWFEGNQVFVGQTEISGEQTFSQKGKVSFNVVSNNGALKDMISGLNCRDVKLKRELQLGWTPKLAVHEPGKYEKTTLIFAMEDYDVVKKLQYLNDFEEVEKEGITVLQAQLDRASIREIPLPDGIVICDKKKVNVEKPYPQMDYCNVSVCCKRGGDKSNDNTGNGYAVYKYDRMNWAPCFYVMYFLECLFDEKNLNISYNFNELLRVDDLTRLAFLNAAPRYDHDGYFGYLSDYDLSQPANDGVEGHFHKTISVAVNIRYTYPKLSYASHHGNDLGWVYSTHEDPWTQISPEHIDDLDELISGKYNMYGGKAIANSDNFPDNTEVQKVFDDLKNAFGVFVDYDQMNKHAEFRLVRDIMKDTKVVQPICTILDDPTITRNMSNGHRTKYSASDEDVYDYKLQDDDIPQEVSIIELVSGQLSICDKKTKYDRDTANFYRIKVNKDTDNEPQVFEVGGYNKYQIGVLINDEGREVEEDSVSESIINFSPVTTNDVWMWYVNRNKIGRELWELPDSTEDSMLAVWIDAESYYNIQEDKIYELNDYGESVKVGSENFHVAFSQFTTIDFKKRLNLHIPNGEFFDKTMCFEVEAEAVCVVRGDCAYDLSQDNNPLALANVGYQLGIMRGPGNKTEEEYTYDYDGEGNDTWYSVPENPCFTADCIDQYGRIFDYNGTGNGIGIEWMTKRMSANEALEYLNNTFPRSNVLFEEQRASKFVYFVNRSQSIVEPRFNYICSYVDKEGNSMTEDEVSSYMIKLANEIGYSKLNGNLSEIYYADKSRKGILIFAEYGITTQTYINSYDSLIKVFASGNDGDALVKVNPLDGRLSLKLDARKVKEYDKDGNPVYFEVADNTVARRGLVPQLLEDFLYFKAHHVKVTFPVLMSLSAINNLQLLKWNRFGDYVGLIKQVNYELTESGLKNVTVELLVANK